MAPLPAGTEEHRFSIKGDGSVAVHGVGSDLAWNFTAIPDRAPTIELIKDPERQARGALRLDYKIERRLRRRRSARRFSRSRISECT